MLAKWLEDPYEQFTFRCGGINHQCSFLEFGRGTENLSPRLRQVIDREEIYGQEPVRIDLMKHFGYFVTESSGHASEYVPYFRKNALMVEEELVPRFTDKVNHCFQFGPTGGHLHHNYNTLQSFRQEFKQIMVDPVRTDRTHEYGSSIIEAMETNQPIRINGNVPNRERIDTLPRGCSLESPSLCNRTGGRPAKFGPLPPYLPAAN